MKAITEAITESRNTDSIVHITVDEANIFGAMDGIDYDDAIENDGTWEVWGDDWRLAVTLTR